MKRICALSWAVTKNHCMMHGQQNVKEFSEEVKLSMSENEISFLIRISCLYWWHIIFYKCFFSIDTHRWPFAAETCSVISVKKNVVCFDWRVLSAFAELQKAIINIVMSVCLAVRLPARMEHLGSHWSDIHGIWYLIVFACMSRKFEFHSNLTRITGTSCEKLYLSRCS